MLGASHFLSLRHFFLSLHHCPIVQLKCSRHRATLCLSVTASHFLVENLLPSRNVIRMLFTSKGDWLSNGCRGDRANGRGFLHLDFDFLAKTYFVTSKSIKMIFACLVLIDDTSYILSQEYLILQNLFFY